MKKLMSNNNMKHTYLPVLALLVALGACQKDTVCDRGPVEIALAATVENIGISTRAPFSLNTPTADNPVTSAIWASTTSHSYKGSQDTEPGPEATVIDYHNSTCFTSGDKQLLDHQLFYPENKDMVYFVGLCPRSQDGWNVDESIPGSGQYDVAKHIFDGKTDVMYASEVKNNLDSSSKLPILTYRHVLTWIKFNVVADSQDAIDAWGKVRKITISSNSRVNINVSTDTCTFDNLNPALPAYCYKKGVSTDIAFENQSIELTTSPQEVAYTLCAAVIAGDADGENEYSITIDTEYRPNTTVPINLKKAGGTDNYAGNTGGCQFTVTLRFKLGENIVTTARATEWSNGGIGVSSITE